MFKGKVPQLKKPRHSFLSLYRQWQ